MPDANIIKEIDYSYSRVMIGYLLDKGLISKEEYEELDRLNAVSFKVGIYA